MALKDFAFKILKKDKFARTGLIETQRGNINTPAFMPVGTQGTVKGIFTDDILKTNTQIILGNTYHLLLRPGIEILNKGPMVVDTHMLRRGRKIITVGADMLCTAAIFETAGVRACRSVDASEREEKDTGCMLCVLA